MPGANGKGLKVGGNGRGSTLERKSKGLLSIPPVGDKTNKSIDTERSDKKSVGSNARRMSVLSVASFAGAMSKREN